MQSMISLENAAGEDTHTRIPYRGILVLLACLFVYAFLINAWVCDDAYITFRTSWNFVEGFGLRWNISERVQVYTSPLWMFVISSGLRYTGNVFLLSIAAGFVFSSLAIFIAGGVIRTIGGKEKLLLFLLLIIGSRAFIDYSSSGLENSLAYFLLALYSAVFFNSGFLRTEDPHRRLKLLLFIQSVVFLTRQDLILITLPPAIHALYEARRPVFKSVVSAVIGFVPAFLWLVFATFYYGSPFPNTAFAKLGVGIPTLLLAERGFWYLLNSLKWDPITLWTIAAAAAASFVSRSRKQGLVAIGAVLYVAYAVYIGGDFMSGRFFSIPFFVSAMVLPLVLVTRRDLIATGILCVVLLLIFPFSPLQIPKRPYVSDRGIGDEKAIYFRHCSLLNYRPGSVYPTYRFVALGIELNRTSTKLHRAEQIGMMGYFAGPGTHIMDTLALADPLLSRLPCNKRKMGPGHYQRDVPEGYPESLLAGENRIRDPRISQYYERILQVCRDPLFAKGRLKTIWDLNLGRYDHLLQGYSGIPPELIP